ncbi:MAG: hypothetical protein MJ176_03275 [Treponema sp.]|nr:hypothetical protein [Treponema sp.]
MNEIQEYGLMLIQEAKESGSSVWDCLENKNFWSTEHKRQVREWLCQNPGYWINEEPKKEIEVGYIPEMDRTVIFENTYHPNGNIKSTKIIGWYFGGPDEKATAEFSDGNLIAEF